MSKFCLPSLSLLGEEKQVNQTVFLNELNSNSKLIENILSRINLYVQVISVKTGPVFSVYTLKPLPETNMDAVILMFNQLSEDKLVSRYRIVGTNQDNSTLIIEIPNKYRELTRLKENLSSKEFVNSKAQIPLMLGVDTIGIPIVRDLIKLKHLLIAGQTGSGKSVFINSILMNFLFKFSPNNLKLILIDPKMLDLSLYDSIPHLLTPVITGVDNTLKILMWCVDEMERRYNLLKVMKCHDVLSFNQRIRSSLGLKSPLNVDKNGCRVEYEQLSNIVIVNDELSDLMRQLGKQAGNLIEKLASKGHVVGIHLILASCCPHQDVFTDQIKLNISSRIAFQVMTKIDSIASIEQVGAEKLIGHGDMLFLEQSSSSIKHIQALLVSDYEVMAVVNHLKGQNSCNI